MLLVTNNPLTAAVATLFRATRLDVPELAYCNDRIAQSFLPRLPTLREGYRPPALSLGVYQSGLASVNDPPGSATQFERETITLPALERSPNKCCPASVPPGVVSIDWLNQPSADATICLLIPGLTGSSDTAYIRRAAVELHNAGVRVGCYNPRGRGGNALDAPFLYSAGYTEDLRRVVRHVRDQWPSAKLTAAGYSLGASYLAKYIGEEGSDCMLSGAAHFACPTDLLTGIRRLGSTASSRFVDKYFLVPSVQKVMKEYMPLLAGAPGLDLDGAAAATSMEGFDGCTIAPMMGCESAEQYYIEASSEELLHRARCPMLFVSAYNDPVAPADVIKQAVFRSDAPDAPLLLAITNEGGHSMSWPEGLTGRGRAWSAAVLVEWVKACEEV